MTSYNNYICLNLQGGTLLSWVNNGQEIFYQGSSEKRSGVPILFPFANPLKNGIFEKSGLPIGQHGFARNSLWKLVSKNIKQKPLVSSTFLHNNGAELEYGQNKANQNLNPNKVNNILLETKIEENVIKSHSSITIQLTNSNISPEMQLAYPYQFTAEIIVDISLPNCLTYTLKVYNTGETNLPIAPGLHPYFPINHAEKAKLEIRKETFKLGEKKLGKVKLSNSLTKPNKLKDSEVIFQGKNVNWNEPSSGFFNNFNTEATILFPNKKIRITEISPKPDIQNLVVWSQTQTQTENDYNFICVEPFTRGTNAINENPIIVSPNKTWEMIVQFEVY